VKQPAGLPDEDRGFTGELSANPQNAFLLLTNAKDRDSVIAK